MLCPEDNLLLNLMKIINVQIWITEWWGKIRVKKVISQRKKKSTPFPHTNVLLAIS